MMRAQATAAAAHLVTDMFRYTDNDYIVVVRGVAREAEDGAAPAWTSVAVSAAQPAALALLRAPCTLDRQFSDHAPSID